MRINKIEIPKEEEPKCTGLVYRADVSRTTTKRGFMSSIRMNELKRKSCNCGACDYIRDTIREIEIEAILDLEEVQHSHLYTIIIVNETRDWESGHIDGFDLQLTKLKNPKEGTKDGKGK